MRTPQQMFDYLAGHLVRQGRPAMRNGRLAYRGEDGAMCPFGLLIPDAYYQESFEDKPSPSLYRFLPADVYAEIHELALPITCCEFVHNMVPACRWRDELERMAAQIGLESPFGDRTRQFAGPGAVWVTRTWPEAVWQFDLVGSFATEGKADSSSHLDLLDTMVASDVTPHLAESRRGLVFRSERFGFWYWQRQLSGKELVDNNGEGMRMISGSPGREFWEFAERFGLMARDGQVPA